MAKLSIKTISENCRQNNKWWKSLCYIRYLLHTAFLRGNVNVKLFTHFLTNQVSQLNKGRGRIISVWTSKKGRGVRKVTFCFCNNFLSSTSRSQWDNFHFFAFTGQVHVRFFLRFSWRNRFLVVVCFKSSQIKITWPTPNTLFVRWVSLFFFIKWAHMDNKIWFIVLRS